MAKITAKTPEGETLNIMDTDTDPVGAVVQGKNDNPDLTNWKIDGKPVKLINKETGDIDK